MLSTTSAHAPCGEPRDPSPSAIVAPSGPDANTYVRHLTCISCPMGCQLTVSVADGAVTSVTGNTCPRGEAYGRAEVLHPVRTVTTTVPIVGSPYVRRLPVKTAVPVPKECVEGVIAALADTRVRVPVRRGDVVMADVVGTGADVVATSDVLA